MVNKQTILSDIEYQKFKYLLMHSSSFSFSITEYFYHINNTSSNVVCLQERPKVFLTLDELTRDYPYICEQEEVKQRPPLFIKDVQQLLLFALGGIAGTFKPR